MSPDETPSTREDEEAASIVSGGSGRILYRAMREDPAGGPMIGPTARMLGVRPQVDIPVTGGQVRPNTGGLSVALDRPENLHPLRRPRRFGGSGKDPAWSLALDLLGPDLQFRHDTPTHGLIEPSHSMSLDEFQQSLADTRPFWRRLP
jgi:hypothetical protein